MWVKKRNRGILIKGNMLRHIKRKDCFTRKEVMLHQGHETEEPLELPCLLEIRRAETGEKVSDTIGTLDQNEVLQ